MYTNVTPSFRSPGSIATFFGLLTALLCWTPNAAWSANCRALYGQKKFVEASKCFVNEANKIGANPTGTQKLKKGRMLRNAALCLERAAKASNSTMAAKHRIEAIKLIDQYLKAKLYPNSNMQQNTQKKRAKLSSQIGYAELRIVTSQANAKACVTGNGLNKCKTTAFWSLKVLPGTYQISTTYPSKPPVTQNKTVQAAARTKKNVIFKPPVKKIALLSAVTGDNRATIVLKGKKLKAPKTHTGASWTVQLPAGAYELMVIYPNQAPIKRQINLVMGQPAVQIFNRPGPPVLIVNTTPINAQVFINGKYSGNTGLRLKLKPGNIKIEIKRGCYQLVTKELQIKANQEYPVSVILKRDPAYLNWRGSKKGGSGAAIGWTALIAGLAIAGTGGAMYGVASGKSSEASQVRPYDFPRYQSLANENNTFVTIGHVGVGVGVVGIAVGIGMLVASRPKSKTDIPCKIPLRDED